MDEFSSDADIFVFAPSNDGMKVEWMRAGFLNFRLGATSRVIRK
jgi:hypothetical protein